MQDLIAQEQATNKMQVLRQVSRHEKINQLTVEYNQASQFLARIYSPSHHQVPAKERMQYAAEARQKQADIQKEMDRILAIKTN